MNDRVKNLVAYYKRKVGSNNPFEIADYLNIEVQTGDLGSCAGCYLYLQKHRCIFLNENLFSYEKELVMAHELGHSILHQKENSYFIRDKTLLLTSKPENEANIFASELLIPNEILLEYWYYTTEQLASLLGYEQKFIEIRLKNR